MKRKKIVKMIDDVIKEGDVLMDEERDYDTAACKLSDVVWTVRKNLMKKIIKESGNNGNE